MKKTVMTGSSDEKESFLPVLAALSERLELDAEEQRRLLWNVNRIAEQLSAEGRPARQTFEYVRSIAHRLCGRFSPRVSCSRTENGTRILFCEPPCGSNTAVLLTARRLLFVDAGFACYHDALFDTLRGEIPGFDTLKKELLLTHADVDHCGELDRFDCVYLNQKCADSFARERQGLPGIREEDARHAPYVKISKIFSRYRPPRGENFMHIGGTSKRPEQLLTPIGRVAADGLCFEVYEGQGGHVPGEMVFIEQREKIVFTGDIYINVKGQTHKQQEYNRIAPYLLNAVDTDPALAKAEREVLFGLLTPGEWILFGGHGAPMPITIRKSP